MQKQYKMAVFSGGGIFGVASNNALRQFIFKQLKDRGLLKNDCKTSNQKEKFQERFDRFFINYFDACCGVSIGSLHAGVLGLGISPNTLRDFYLGNWKKFKHNFNKLQSLRLLTPVDKKLGEIIGDKTFSDCKIYSLILRLNRMEKRFSWASYPGNEDVIVREAIISSCSEPVVFPTYFPKSGGAFGGGGLSIYNRPIFAGVQFSGWLKEVGKWENDIPVKYYIFDTGFDPQKKITMKKVKRTDWILPRALEAITMQMEGVEKDILKLASYLGIDYEFYTMRRPDYGSLAFVKEKCIKDLDRVSDLYFRQFFNIE